MTPVVSTRVDNAPGGNWGGLMAAAQMGDADAYRILLFELACWLGQYFARRLSLAMIKDAVRNVLLAITRSGKLTAQGVPLEPWLASIARYKWLDCLRALRFEVAESRDENVEILDPGVSVIAGSTFQQLLAQLKPCQAEAIRLVKLQGL